MLFGTTFDELRSKMNGDSDIALAQLIAKTLEGKFWEVTAGEWWVVVEGMSRQKLVILTNDPFGASFSPKELTIALTTLRTRVLQHLLAAGVIYEDGSWAIQHAS